MSSPITSNNFKPNRHPKHRSYRQSRKKAEKVNAPAANVRAEEWGSTLEPWPTDAIDSSDVSKEIVSAWLQNVRAAENGGEMQKMEGLYDRLDREREKWDEKLKNPTACGWGRALENDWDRHSTTPAERDSLLRLVSRYAKELNTDGQKRSYAFVKLSPEGMAEKIRDVACQLMAFEKEK